MQMFNSEICINAIDSLYILKCIRIKLRIELIVIDILSIRLVIYWYSFIPY